jgi:ribosomal protein L32
MAKPRGKQCPACGKFKLFLGECASCGFENNNEKECTIKIYGETSESEI